jgi:hypothetical protein
MRGRCERCRIKRAIESWMQLVHQVRRAGRERLPRPNPNVTLSSLRRASQPESPPANATFGHRLPFFAEVTRAQRLAQREPKRIPVAREGPTVRTLEVRAAELPEPLAAQVALNPVGLEVVRNFSHPTDKGGSIRQ